MLGALDREGAALADVEDDADDPLAVGCALCDAEEFVPAELELADPVSDAACDGELAVLFGVLPDVREAEGEGAAGDGIEGSVSMGSAATCGGPAGPDLL